MWANKAFADISNLELHIYVVGYPDRGESQVVIIKDSKSNKIHFSAVIDCYEHETINMSYEILENNGIDKLDLFIWTHTDEDHSYGIKSIISKFCDANTNFILPEGVNGRIGDFINYNPTIQSTFDIINRRNLSRKYNVNSTSVTTGNHSNLFSKIYIDKKTGAEIEFEIISISPLSALIRRKIGIGSVKKKNDLSIATIFRIGETRLLFSSDIEDQSILQIPDYYFENLSIVKTPHHTSKSSLELLNKINFSSSLKTSIQATISTIYQRFNLPDPSAINEYKKISNNFYSTGVGKDKYGYVHLNVDVLRDSIKDIQLHGNATIH